MRPLPRILIIDDDYGRSNGKRNKDREDFCFRLGISDITGDSEPELIPNPIAEAFFCPGQINRAGHIENDLEGALETIRRGLLRWPRWALILIDLHFKTGLIDAKGHPAGRDEDRIPERYFGLRILDAIRQDSRLCNIPVVILSSMDRELVEQRFSDAGARDFHPKEKMNREDLKNDLNDYGLIEDESGLIIGRSLPLLMCLQTAREKARSGTDNALILGETGTGKDSMANYIHKHSPKQNGPFQLCLFHGTTETLVDATLFGYMKGAFTGAERDKAGLAELANHGTLFIDEFGDIPPSIQPKLLRLLDKNTRESQRLDSSKIKKLNIQVVMATNRFDALSAGGIRWDILHRIGIGEADLIVLPPLRERREDIPLLANFFLRKYENKFKAVQRRITEEALQELMNYSWPGNVRELEGIIEQAVSKYKVKFLSKIHLSLGIGTALHKSRSSAQYEPEGVSYIGQQKGIEKQGPDISKETLPDISTLIEYLKNFLFDALNPELFYGYFPELEKAYGELVARYLKAALIETKKLTPRKPGGKILYTTAVEYMHDSKLSSSKAQDLIIKYLNISPASATALLSDPMLKEVYEHAMAQRRNGDKQKKRERKDDASPHMQREGEETEAN